MPIFVPNTVISHGTLTPQIFARFPSRLRLESYAILSDLLEEIEFVDPFLRPDKANSHHMPRVKLPLKVIFGHALPERRFVLVTPAFLRNKALL